jgi:hypothetical protein
MQSQSSFRVASIMLGMTSTPIDVYSTLEDRPSFLRLVASGGLADLAWLAALHRIRGAQQPTRPGTRHYFEVSESPSNIKRASQTSQDEKCLSLK